MSTRVIVRGHILQEPLLDSDKAVAIEIYDHKGDLVALFGKVLSNDFWSFSKADDPDWASTLKQMGFTNAPTYKQMKDQRISAS